MTRRAVAALIAVAAMSTSFSLPSGAAVPVHATNAAVYVAGRQVMFEHLGIAYNDPVTPAGDAGLRSMLELVNAQLNWQPGTRFAVITRADGALITLTVGSIALSVDGSAVAMPFAPFYNGSELYLPLLPIAKALQLGVRGFRGGYIFVPQLVSVSPRSDAHRTIVAMTTSAPAAYRSSFDAKTNTLLVSFPGFGSAVRGSDIPISGSYGSAAKIAQSGPPGFPTTTVAIGVQRGVKFTAHRVDGEPTVDAVLARDEAALHLDDATKTSGHVTRAGDTTPPPVPSPTPPELRSGATATPTAAPSRAPLALATARPVPPTAHPVIAVAAATSRPTSTPKPTATPTPMPTATPTPIPSAAPSPTPSAAPTGPAAHVEATDTGSPPASPTPVEIYVTNVSATDIPGAGTRVTLTLTGGPVSFEWHRLAEPDNRYWVDIKGVALTGPSQTMTSALPFLKEIKVTQFALDPDRIVRIALEPTQPVDVNIGAVAGSPGQMGIEIEAVPPAADAPRAGVGVVTWEGTPAPSRVATQRDLIVIDPGHGGNDPGAANSSYGLVESKLTLAISQQLRDDLRRLGWRVVMTRDADYEVGDPKGDDRQELQARCDVANAAGARVFVSVHINSSVAQRLTGTTTYYWRPADKAFAEAVQSAVIAADGITNDGVKRNNFYVIKNTTMPAVLVETAFLSNPSDAALLAQPAFLARVASGIAQGIMNYTGGPQAPVGVVKTAPPAGS